MLMELNAVREHLVAIQQLCEMVDLQNLVPTLVSYQTQSYDPDSLAMLPVVAEGRLQSAISAP